MEIPPKNKPLNIAMLLSGGVDSSVSLALLSTLKEHGHSLRAFYIKVWLQDEFTSLGSCPWEEDLGYAQKVCQQFDVPLEVISLQKEYWEKVVEVSIAAIKKGLTPNPDVYCNSKIKFGEFLQQIGPDYDKVASGHYARLETYNNNVILKSSTDTTKDQTYFLAYLKKSQLQRCIFPLGLPEELFQQKTKTLSYALEASGCSNIEGQVSLNKKQVRLLARFFNLPNQQRQESMGVCFLGKIKFRDFIRFHLGSRQGKIVEWKTGKILGEHSGHWYYTIGQRQGIGLSGGPWYVVKKEETTNVIYVSSSISFHGNTEMFMQCQVIDINWLLPVKKDFYCQVKIRHAPYKYPARVTQTDQKNHCHLRLFQADGGIANGQFAVFYCKSLCLGSGLIHTP